MERNEFKDKLCDIVDGCIDSNRELTEDDQERLIDNIGDVATTILDSETAEDGEGDGGEGAQAN